jgi:hypothetical protein
MRTEDDLRAALQSLERHAPDLAEVLPAVLPAVTVPGTARAARARRREPRRGQRPWLRTGGPVLVALAVCAAVLTPLTVGKIFKDEMGNGQVGSVPPTLTAAQVLTAAARVAAAQPAQATGKYWRVSIASMKLIPAGPNARPYALRETLSPWVTWYPVQRAKPSEWFIAYSDAGYTTAPATPGAAAQWQADGSPALPSANLPVMRTQAFSDLRYGPSRLTPAQFRALPGDPVKLKAQIEQTVRNYSSPGWKYGHSVEVFGIITDLLDHEPITPQVRAAAFQVLAGLPGIVMMGKVTDPAGRPGYMIGIDGGAYKTFGESRMLGGNVVLVISPQAGTLLAEESVAAAQPLPADGKRAPASGALPGQTACGAVNASSGVSVINGGPDARRYTFQGKTWCVPKDATVTVGPGGNGTSDAVWWAVPRQAGAMTTDPLGPVIAVAPGTVTGAYVILSAGWTDATPAPGA